MEETKIEITVSEYQSLLRKAERIAVIERMAANNAYFATSEILAILDAKKETKEC